MEIKRNENAKEQGSTNTHSFSLSWSSILVSFYFLSSSSSLLMLCIYIYILNHHEFHLGLVLPLYCSNDKFTIRYWLRRHKILNDDLFIENFFICPFCQCRHEVRMHATTPIVRSVPLTHWLKHLPYLCRCSSTYCWCCRCCFLFRFFSIFTSYDW